MGDSKYSMLGDPMSKQGAIFISKDIEGGIQAFTDIIKKTLQANGIVVTPQIEQEISLYFKTQQENREQISQKIKEVALSKMEIESKADRQLKIDI